MQILLSRIDLLFHSIRFRLVLWFILILSVVLILFSILLIYARIQELRAEAINILEAKYGQVMRYIHSDVLGITNPNELHSGGENSVLGPLDVLALINAEGAPVYISGPLTRPPILNLSRIDIDPSQHVVEYKTYIRGKSIDLYTFLITPVVTTGRALTGFIVVGTPIDPRSELKSLVVTLLILTALMLLLAFAGGFILADRALRPIKTIIKKVRSIGETDLEQRLSFQSRDEIGQLADTFDLMLARLEAAFMRQRQFTADASHELRTPLTIINLEAARALEAPRGAEEYQRALDVIRSENVVMTRLVNDLLTLARMDAGHMSVHKSELDLSSMLLEVLERLEPLASRLDVQLVAGELPEVRILADRQSIFHLLSNLVENALKYTASNPTGRQRQVMVHVDTEAETAMARVCVIDTGPGIPAEHLVHIFDRFYRSDLSRSRNLREAWTDLFPTSGSGLGLAIAQAIARQHGGRIEVLSKEGEGSTFLLFLPRAG